MQMNAFSSPDVRASLTWCLNPARMHRYKMLAQGDEEFAFLLYAWNCELSEAFYVPLQFCEISCRNALCRVLIARCGDAWFEHKTFVLILDQKYRDDLHHSLRKLRSRAPVLSSDDVVTELSFGFWEHLTTKRFERFLWAKGIASAFPGAPHGSRFVDVQRLIESVRLWRNRIAHHRAVFDKRPLDKHADAIKLLQWISPQAGEWMAGVSRVPEVFAARPTAIRR